MVPFLPKVGLPSSQKVLWALPSAPVIRVRKPGSGTAADPQSRKTHGPVWAPSGPPAAKPRVKRPIGLGVRGGSGANKRTDGDNKGTKRSVHQLLQSLDFSPSLPRRASPGLPTYPDFVCASSSLFFSVSVTFLPRAKDVESPEPRLDWRETFSCTLLSPAASARISGFSCQLISLQTNPDTSLVSALK